MSGSERTSPAMQTAVRPSMKTGGDMGVGVLVEGEDDAFVRVVEPGPSTSMAPACANRSLPFLGGTTCALYVEKQALLHSRTRRTQPRRSRFPFALL